MIISTSRRLTAHIEIWCGLRKTDYDSAFELSRIWSMGLHGEQLYDPIGIGYLVDLLNADPIFRAAGLTDGNFQTGGNCQTFQQLFDELRAYVSNRLLQSQ